MFQEITKCEIKNKSFLYCVCQIVLIVNTSLMGQYFRLTKAVLYFVIKYVKCLVLKS